MDLTLILVLANIFVSAYALHKIRKIHLSTYRLDSNITQIHQEVGNLYPQIQAYLDLSSLIQPRYAGGRHRPIFSCTPPQSNSQSAPTPSSNAAPVQVRSCLHDAAR